MNFISRKIALFNNQKLYLTDKSMLKTAKFVLAALTLSSAEAVEWAMVHDYIHDDECKEHYISKHRPACVTEDGHCFPPNHKETECRDVETW